MVIRCFVDRNTATELSAVDPTVSGSAHVHAALENENRMTSEVSELARSAPKKGFYLEEQWFLQEQVSEVATMNTLAKATPRAGDDLVELENFAAPELPRHRRR